MQWNFFASSIVNWSCFFVFSSFLQNFLLFRKFPLFFPHCGKTTPVFSFDLMSALLVLSYLGNSDGCYKFDLEYVMSDTALLLGVR